MATWYLDSKYQKSFKLDSDYTFANDTNVPVVVLHNFGNVYRSDGLDIVVTTSLGVLVSRTISDIGGGSYAVYLKDPAQTIVGGGTELYLQWGGETVNVANDLTVWTNCHGSTDDYVLNVHGEESSANLIDATGNYTATDANITYGQTGQIGKAPSFNGSSSNSNWGDITQLNSATKFTWSFWIKPTSLTANDRIAMKGANTNDYMGVYYTTNLLTVNFRTAGVSNIGNAPFNAVAKIGSWSHVTVSYDGGLVGNANRLKVYIDGVLQTMSFPTGAIPATAANLTGVNYYLSWISNHLDGLLDEFRIFTGALSAEQDKTQYNNQDLFSTNGSLILGDTSTPGGLLNMPTNSVSNSIKI